MSAKLLQVEVTALILRSGIKPDKKMRCSLLRTIRMRHGAIDPQMANDAVEAALDAMV
ncbi:MAG: hypothetical protein JXK05_05795 [Campylobacterales bacterium]|nr:hypothetical protein [Campylobacterales bacterium]